MENVIAHTYLETSLLEPTYRDIRRDGPLPDLEILASFVRVAELASFTKAAHALNRSQSTISLHVSRLEELYGCKLLHRNTKSVALSSEGEMLLSLARRMLQLHAVARTQLTKGPLAGMLRVGIIEDFAVWQLPQVLHKFAAIHPRIRLELRTAVSADLMAAQEEEQLDIVVARRAVGELRGEVIWREPLSWVGMRDHPVAGDGPLPLVLFSHGCFYRPLVTAALDEVGRPWRIACTSTGLPGVCAAVYAGFGLTVLADSTIPSNLYRLPRSLGLPPLPMTEIAAFASRRAPRDLTAPLIDLLRSCFVPPQS